METDLTLNNTFIIPVMGDYLIYSPLNGIYALVNRKALQELKSQKFPAKNDCGDPESKFHDLAKEILNNPVQSIKRKTGTLNPEFLGIIPTRSCNGACNYCDFGANEASSEKMSYQLAAKAVSWYAGILESHQRNLLEIHFFGGEPMMARDVIQVVVQKARSVAAEKNLIPWFEISTNGQYSSDHARFLGQYFNRVVLSLDGPEDIQSRHRPLKENRCSFKNACNTAEIISSSGAELCIRCCISQINIESMEEFTVWLCENFRLSGINFEILCPTVQTEAAGLFPPDPVDFAIHFQKSREIGESYGINVVYASDISGQPVVSSCPVGKDTAIISPDGRISSCYLMPERWQEAGLDLDFGIINSKREVQTNPDKMEAIRRMVENKPRCTHCFCKWSCAGGCHVGNTWPGCSLVYNDFCIQSRLISTFSLLSDLGLQNKVQELIQSPVELQKIARQISDNIYDIL
jgi:uncharacterized protein